MKVIQQGKFITLYSYSDDLKIRFYLQDSASPDPQELVYKVWYDRGDLPEVFAFRRLLISVGEQAGVMTDKLRAQIGRTYYNESQILKIVSQINGTKNERIKIAHKAATGFRAGFGVNVARLHYYGDDEYAKNAQSSPSVMYWFSVGYDLAKTPM